MDEEECRLIHHTKDNYEDQPDTKNSKLFDESSPKLSPWHHGWKLSTLFLGIIAVVQLILLALHALAPHPSTIGSYATGFTTEFDSAKPHISLEQHRFGSALHRNPNGTLSRLEGKPGEMAYVGRDTEATNRAWDNLIARRYFILDDKEINQFNSDELSYPDLEPLHNIKSHTGKHGVFAGVEMLHSLHCLDSLRRQLDGQPGHGGNNEEQKKMHIDHCVDHLRQSIMCNADLTPVILYPVLQENSGTSFVGDTQRPHTCRNFEALRDWVLSRDWFIAL